MSIWETAGASDEWYTPKYIFDALNYRRFDMDVSSPVDRSFCHVPANHFITYNSLNMVWSGFLWCNPPFAGRNGIVPWLNKMHQHGNGIALTPDRSSAPWWQKACKQSEAVLFIAGKVKFIRPDGSTGNAPGNGTTLFAYGDHGRNALLQAEENGLGICLCKLRYRR